MKYVVKLFTLLLLVGTSISTAHAQSSSYTSCHAYTACVRYDGNGRAYNNGTISCQVYGSSYAFGTSDSACSWSVMPYQSVDCSGYIRSRDMYGNTVWGWQNYHVDCP